MKRTQNPAFSRFRASLSHGACFLSRAGAFLFALGGLALTAPAVAQLDTDPLN
jgi:hypothetical protein